MKNIKFICMLFLISLASCVGKAKATCEEPLRWHWYRVYDGTDVGVVTLPDGTTCYTNDDGLSCLRIK